MLEQLGQNAPKVKRILELNPNHPLISKLQTLFRENRNDPRLGSYAALLLGQAHLAESGALPDPASFSVALNDVMLRGV
jgi:molecular chaperone HtpG